MKDKIDRDELAGICDARDKICNFCEANGNCDNCMVTYIVNDAMNSCPEYQDDDCEIY